MTTPALHDLTSTEVESGVSLFTGEPFIAVRHFGETVVLRGQFDPPAAEAMALVLTQAAESARHDAALFAELTAAGLPDHVKGAIVSGVRDRRHAMAEDE